MVQAWRLYRAHQCDKHRKQLVLEKEEDARLEEEILNSSFLKSTVTEKRRERRQEKRKRRTEERKLEDISLVEFTRQVVDVLFKKHGDQDRRMVPVASAVMAPATLAEVRYDSGRHMVRLTKRRGVCKECTKRTYYRCIRCNVALHPDDCFYKFHVPEEEWEDME